MRTLQPVWIAIGFIAIFALSGAAAFIFLRSNSVPVPAKQVATTTVPTVTQRVLGKSVEGRNIDAYTYGKGSTHLVFVGGIHGGYEWNSVVLAYQVLDYLDAHAATIPKNLRVTVIPNLNPDGVFKIIGKEGRFGVNDVSTIDSTPGRFNANDVDLNRNFDCNWKPEGTWRNKTVSAGTEAFSEPEAKALRDFALSEKPDAFVFWHSQANAVYASQCNDGILPKTLEIMNAYAQASKYPAVKTFDAYVVNGASEDWLASIGIPAITVELQTHETIEWERNIAGVQALLKYFTK